MTSRSVPLQHLSEHVDLDLEASSALRFHFGELVLSVGWRAGQIMLLGASPLALSAWQMALFLSILFHHSNISNTRLYTLASVAGTMAGPLHRHAAHARDSSLGRAGGDKRQLVARPDAVGLASWDTQIEYTLGRDHD